jgi:cytochrome P450
MFKSDSVNLTLLCRSPQRCFQYLLLDPPGIYCLSKRHPKVFIVTVPKLAMEVLGGANGAIVKSALPDATRPILGDGAAASWFPPEPPIEATSSASLDSARKRRGNAVSKFLQTSIANNAGAIERIVAEFSHGQSNSETIDVYAAMHDLMFRIAMECIFKAAVTEELLEANHVIRKSGPILHHHLRSYWGLSAPYFDRTYQPRFELWRWLPGSRFTGLRARRRAIDTIADYLISNGDSTAARTSHPDHGLLDLSIHIPGQTIHQQRSTIVGLLLASYENTASACAWAIWCLASYPEWQDRVVAEITTAPVEFADFDSFRSHCPSLTATLHETLRLYPPVWSIGRVVKVSLSLGDCGIPGGSSIIISPWLQHRHPKLWKDSERFDPDRFGIGARHSDDGAFLPFGNKPHRCPGEEFSWFTLALTVAEMLKRWRFIPAEGFNPQPMFGLTQRPTNGMMMRFSRRD